MGKGSEAQVAMSSAMKRAKKTIDVSDVVALVAEAEAHVEVKRIDATVVVVVEAEAEAVIGDLVVRIEEVGVGVREETAVALEVSGRTHETDEAVVVAVVAARIEAIDVVEAAALAVPAVVVAVMVAVAVEAATDVVETKAGAGAEVQVIADQGTLGAEGITVAAVAVTVLAVTMTVIATVTVTATVVASQAQSLTTAAASSRRLHTLARAPAIVAGGATERSSQAVVGSAPTTRTRRRPYLRNCSGRCGGGTRTAGRPRRAPSTAVY